MASEKPSVGSSNEEVAEPSIAPEPEGEPEAASPANEEKDVWAEDYDEHIDAEEPLPKKPKKKRKWGAVVAIVIILLIIVLWTALSPEVMPQSGDTYLRHDDFANLSGFAGNVKTYAGNATWAISVGGDEAVPAGTQLNITILITKVHEETSSFWFRGMAIELQNASLYTEGGTFLAEMTGKTGIGFGKLATVPITFAEPGPHNLTAYAKFLVYADMRIGYLPVKAVEIESEVFSIQVS